MKKPKLIKRVEKSKSKNKNNGELMRKERIEQKTGIISL
jgi:hypothetical protein